MADNRIQMPSGMGGLVRYFDEYRSKVEFKPGHIVILCIIIILVLLFLQAFGSRFISL